MGHLLSHKQNKPPVLFIGLAQQTAKLAQKSRILARTAPGVLFKQLALGKIRQLGRAPPRRRKLVVQILENPNKLRTKSEKWRRKRLASICCNLLLFSGLRRLRQDLVNLIPR
jgi:hypothetical protein